MKPENITSRANPRLKHARSVMRGDDPALIFVEGSRLVEEALRSAIEIREVFVTETRLQNASFVSAFDSISCPVWKISESLADSISDTKNPQGIFVIASRPRWTLADLAGSSLVVYLHEINNPANLGAIIRTAEAAGASGVVVSKRSADPFSSKSLRGAMGSAFRMPVVEGIDPVDAIEWAAVGGLATAAADIDGVTSYTEIDWTKPRLLVFGSEAHGLDKDIKKRVDDSLTIPMKNGVESLNLAVSCGVILFEAARQKGR